MRGRWMLAAVAMAITPGLDASSESQSSEAEPFPCGGYTTRAEANAYFSRLEAALLAEGPKSRFNEFVAPTFLVIDAKGRSLWFRRADFKSITPGRIRIEEWREISARGLDAVKDVGWRGCMMDHGKVWFESSETSGLELKSFNRTMAWDLPNR